MEELKEPHHLTNFIVSNIRNSFGENEITDMVDFFKVMGDCTRLKILWTLDYGEMCVCDIAKILDMTKSAISHQLKLLRDARLIKSRRNGKHIFYSLSDDHIAKIFETAVEHVREKE